MKYFIPDAPQTAYDRDGKSKSGRYCTTCGDRISDHKQKIFGQWVCDLALLDNGNWIHAKRIYDYELQGRTVVERLIPNV